MKTPNLIKSGEVCKLVWKKTNIEERRDIIFGLLFLLVPPIRLFKKKLGAKP